MTMMKNSTIFVQFTVAFIFLFRITSAVVTCPNTETNAIYHGRKHWTIPDAMTTYNDTDLASCSVFCRQDTNCKSFAVAEDTCTLYSIQVGKNTRKLVKDIKSVHFDSLQVTQKNQSRFGTCLAGNLCDNGATCVNDCSDRGYSCICAETFRGINCEHRVIHRLSFQATIPIEEPRRITHFWSEGRLYIVTRNTGESSEGLYVFKYNVLLSTYEQIQFIADSLVWRVRVFTMDDDVYVSKGKAYSTDPMHVYRFNPETEQFEDTFTIECGGCSTSFLQDSRGDSNLFVARYKNPDKTTNSEMYSFTRDTIGGKFSQVIATNGLDATKMFEMDGSNYLVLAQKDNTGGDVQDTLIYRQRHDYGRPATASVFAIFILSEECYTATDGVDYQGIVSTTTGGYTCQKWTDQTPHTHSFTPETYLGSGLGDHNHCRNPDSITQPWCYTTSAAQRWQICDVGPPVTSCTKKWKLVYKAVSGVNNVDLYDLWNTAGSRNEGNQDAMKLDDSFRDHYKSSLVDAWDKVSKVKIALYDNGESKLSLIFNAVGATKTEWFTKARLLNYPWKDLRTKTPATFNMVMTGTNGRRYWNIFDVLGNCRDRILWLSVAPFVGCIHELTEPVPVFMYSDRKTSIKAQPDVLIDSYLDNGAEKSLSSYILKSPGVTAWDCLDLCRGLDYKYAGVNNKHTECYCGDSGYDSGGTATYTQRVESDVTLMMNTVQPWELHQTISDTNFPKKTDSFEHDGNYYIIVQSTENSEARPLYTHVYKYRKSTELFETHQLIDSPYKFNTFTLVQAYRQWYLIFPPIKDISTNSMSGLKAAFYRLEGHYFIKNFEKDTCSSYGWGSFTVNNDVYIIEGNSYGEPCDSPNSNGNLKIYKWI